MPTCGVPVGDGQKRTLTLTIVLLWGVLCESVVRGGAGRAPTMRSYSAEADEAPPRRVRAQASMTEIVRTPSTTIAMSKRLPATLRPTTPGVLGGRPSPGIRV